MIVRKTSKAHPELDLSAAAGAGSYEPGDRTVTAVEPSQTMIDQRTTSCRVICSSAEELYLLIERSMVRPTWAYRSTRATVDVVNSRSINSRGPLNGGVRPKRKRSFTKLIPLFLILIFGSALCLRVQSQEARKNNVSEPALRKELLERVDQDQAIRKEQIAEGIGSPDEDLAKRMQAMDSANTVRMKEIVAKYGWPSPELVGRDGVQAAFLLVQHADFNFQKEVLPLVEKAFRDGKLPGQNYALLLDRVLIRDGKLQVYGTQAKLQGAEIAFEPIEDEPNVDKRRREIGLPPLSEYQKMLKDVYFQPSNEKK